MVSNVLQLQKQCSMCVHMYVCIVVQYYTVQYVCLSVCILCMMYDVYYSPNSVPHTIKRYMSCMYMWPHIHVCTHVVCVQVCSPCMCTYIYNIVVYILYNIHHVFFDVVASVRLARKTSCVCFNLICCNFCSNAVVSCS